MKELILREIKTRIADYFYIKKRFAIRKISGLFASINCPFAIATIWWISTKPVPSLKPKETTQLKILIIDNPGGTIDLEAAYFDEKPPYSFITMDEESLRGVCRHFFGPGIYEYNYTSISSIDKERCRAFLRQAFHYYKKVFKIKAVLAQSFNYWALREFASMCVSEQVHYLIIHRESLYTFGAMEAAVKKNTNDVGPFCCTAIAVHNSRMRELLIRSKIIDQSKVLVIGQARSDYLYRSKTKKNILKSEKLIVFFLISEISGLPKFGHGNIQPVMIENRLLDDTFSFEMLAEKTLELVLKYAQEHPDLNFIIKGKYTGSYGRMLSIISSKDLKNVELDGSLKPSMELIANATAVIGFNTTALYEALILNKPLLIPQIGLDDYMIKYYQLPFDIFATYFNNYRDLELGLDNILAGGSFVTESLETNDLRDGLLNDALGNSDGRAGLRLRKFLATYIK